MTSTGVSTTISGHWQKSQVAVCSFSEFCLLFLKLQTMWHISQLWKGLTLVTVSKAASSLLFWSCIIVAAKMRGVAPFLGGRGLYCHHKVDFVPSKTASCLSVFKLQEKNCGCNVCLCRCRHRFTVAGVHFASTYLFNCNYFSHSNLGSIIVWRQTAI